MNCLDCINERAQYGTMYCLPHYNEHADKIRAERATQRFAPNGSPRG